MADKSRSRTAARSRAARKTRGGVGARKRSVRPGKPVAGNELKSIIETARQTEKDGKAFYRKAASGTENPLARKMFEGLAEAEDEHLGLIERLAAGDFRPVTYRGEFVRKLASVFVDASEEIRELASKAAGDSEVLKVGIEMEDRSLAFYRKWAATACSDNARALCERLAAEEEDHWKILRNTLDYLDETGNWFMAQERWSFDGGGAFA